MFQIILILAINYLKKCRKDLFMKFIFPQNYNFKNKLFGIIDYSDLFFNIIWNLFIFLLINLIFKNNTIKIFIFIIFSLPVLLFSIFSFKLFDSETV